MKKIQSFIIALAMVMSLAASVMPAGVSAAGLTLDTGYEFIDTAYSASEGVYLALARDYKNFSKDNLPTVIYRSTDGINWVKAKSFSNSLAYQSANQYSRQTLIWWEEANVFAFAAGPAVYTSPDGITWTKYNGISRGNAMLASDGDSMVVSGGRAVKLVTPETISATVDYHIFDPASSATTTLAVGVSPKDAEGNRTYVSVSSGKFWMYPGTYDTTVANGNLTDVKTASNSFGANADNPVVYEMVYSNDISSWLMASGSANLHVLRRDGAYSQTKVSDDDAKVTAVGEGNGMIVVGKSDGSIYYAKSSDGISSSTVWKKAISGGITASSEIRSISKTAEGEFVIASKDKLYIGETVNEKLSYKDIDTYKKIGAPVLVDSSVFDGVKLVGGAYSPELDRYIAFGNNTSGTGGRFFSSEDGLVWTAGEKTNVSFSTVTNNAVWWNNGLSVDGENNKQGIFVVSTSTNATVGTGYYSVDGYHWTYSETQGLFGQNGDIIVHDGALYTTVGQNGFRKISALPVKTDVDGKFIGCNDTTFTHTSKNYFTHIAISEDGRYVFLSGAYGAAVIYDTEDGSVQDANDGPNTASITSAKWGSEAGKNGNVGCFIGPNSAATNAGGGFIGMWAELPSGETDWRAITMRPAGITNFISFADTGTRYVYGVDGGRLYASSDRKLVSASTLTEIGVSQTGCEQNTLNIINTVAGKNGQVIAMASDGTNSDILLVDSSCSGYKKVSDNNIAGSVIPGAEYDIKVNYINNSSESGSAKMVAAVYSSENTLIQVELYDLELKAETTENIVEKITFADNVDSTCKMKIMMFKDLTSLIPLSQATDFFQ